MILNIGVWDIALLAVVTVQATAISYLHNPKWKVFVWSLPVPFTLASLALGRPIDATNVMGLNMQLIYTHGVRLLYTRLKIPIVFSIVASAMLYCIIGWQLAQMLPATDMAFWITTAATFVLGAALFVVTSHREEPGHRSPLPVYIKAPLVACVILLLIAVKNNLQGFMTMFPMVGVAAAYEARKSLWAMSRQVPVLMMAMTPLMAVCRLGQYKLGLGISLLIGWPVFGLVLALFTRHIWAEIERDLSE